MPIPDYESLMLPLLLLCGDGKAYKISDACLHYHAHYETTTNDLVLAGRFGTAKNCLVEANLLEAAPAKSFQITPHGKKLLKKPPQKLTRLFLRQTTEVVPATPPSVKPAASTLPVSTPPKSADDLMKCAHKQNQTVLLQAMRDALKQTSPHFFEKLLVDLLVSMGYGSGFKNAAQAVGRSGDGGIDGVIKEDPLGLSTIYIQAKKRDGAGCVGENDLQKFVGALNAHQPCKGVFITTGQFSIGAKEYVKNLSSKMVLIDGEQLAKYMIDFNVGVSVRETYQIKKIDLGYFAEE